jgi:hypothetical protein
MVLKQLQFLETVKCFDKFSVGKPKALFISFPCKFLNIGVFGVV